MFGTLQKRCHQERRLQSDCRQQQFMRELETTSMSFQWQHR